MTTEPLEAALRTAQLLAADIMLAHMAANLANDGSLIELALRQSLADARRLVNTLADLHAAACR